MKTLCSVMVLGMLTLTAGCAHHGHGHHGSRDKASCCKEDKGCKDGSCKLKKGEKKDAKGKSCCSGK